MKKLMIAAALMAGFVGLASIVQAHHPGCPSGKDWAKCLWHEIDSQGSG